MAITVQDATQLVSKIKLVGRWVIKPIHGVDCLYTTNLGSCLKFNLTNCQQIEINCFNNGSPFSAPQQIAIRIDHQTWQRQFVNQTTPLKLSPQPHQIEIMFVGNSDLDEVWDGRAGLAIKAITTSSTAIITPTSINTQVTFIGDSITAGLWLTGKQPVIDDAPYANYVGLISDQLNLDATYLAYSAAGLLRPGTGGVPTVDHYLTKIDRDTNFQAIPADIVVINLGTNDTNYAVADFQKRLVNFYQQLRATYPDTPLMFLVPFNQAFAPIFHAVLDVEPVTLIETNQWRITYTDQVHPDLNGSKVITKHLAPIIANQLLN